MANARPSLTHVTTGDPEYGRLAQEEAEFWAKESEGFLETVEGLGDSPVERHTNRRFTGSEDIHWYETIAGRGRFTRGLALGTSALGQDARILEMNPGLHMTFCDIAAGSLARWQDVLGRRFPGRVQTMTADLNFIDLPENAYDLIVSSSTLHHVINLEHVAAQINRALTPPGMFLMQDYVGESGFRFSDAKKQVYETLFNREVARKRRKPGLEWFNEDPERYSPFCGIRSASILPVLAAHLAVEDVRIAHTIIGLMLYSRPLDLPLARGPAGLPRRAWNRLLRSLPLRRPLVLSPEYLEELLVVDEVLTDAAVLDPFNAFGVYRKRL